MNNLPLQIGITGGIGAGKSTICKVFGILGVPVYNADDRAKWLMNHDEVLKKEIITAFSNSAYNDQELDVQYVASHVFHDQSQLNTLNSLVHPTVGKDYDRWVKRQVEAAYVIKEAALLFETGGYLLMDKNIVVTAPESLRIDRVLQRDPHRDKAQIKAIIGKQTDVSTAIQKADYVLDNSGEEMLLAQILRLDKGFRE